MINYATQWKKKTNFHQIAYNEFVTIPDDVGIYMAKMDGMLGALVFDNSNFFFQTTTGKEIVDIPVLAEYKAVFDKHKITQAIIPGELMAQKGGVLLPFNDVQSIVKTSYLAKNKDLVYHYPVDIVSLNNSNIGFMKAMNILSKIIGKAGLPHIRLPKTKMGKLEDFRKLYEEVYKQPGFDGVIARNYNGKNYKVKFVESVDLTIIGAGHEDMKAWSKGEVSYLLTAFIDKDGMFRSSSKIGTGFKRDERIKFFKFVNDNYLYKEKGEYFLNPQIVVEMNYFRSRITNTPKYKFEKGIYKYVGEDKSVTFSHPSFERLRKDKKATKYDTRLEQVPEFSY